MREITKSPGLHHAREPYFHTSCFPAPATHPHNPILSCSHASIPHTLMLPRIHTPYSHAPTHPYPIHPYTDSNTPAVSQRSLCNVLRPRVSHYSPLYSAAVKHIPHARRPLPLADPPPGHRLSGVRVQRAVGWWEVRIGERLPTLRGQKL